MVGAGGCRDGTHVPSAARVAINITLGRGGRHGSAVPTCGGHCRGTPVPSAARVAINITLGQGGCRDGTPAPSAARVAINITLGQGGYRDGTPVPSAARVAINITLGQGGRHGSAVPTCGGHCRDTPVPARSQSCHQYYPRSGRTARECRPYMRRTLSGHPCTCPQPELPSILP